MLHLPPSTIMEYKSNNGAYARSLSLLSSLKQIHRLHGRQIFLSQFNYRPHTTFMTIIIPFFKRPDFRVCYHVPLYPFLSTRCPRPLLDSTSFKKRELDLQTTTLTMGNNKTKATHDIAI